MITDEVVRFRALKPEVLMRSIRAILAAGALIISRSPKADFLREYTREQVELAQRSIREFVARYTS